jgi:hypothetical protein
MTHLSLSYIDKIDFTLIKTKMSNKVDGTDLTLEQIDIAESEYRNFLKLLVLYPEKEFVPSKLIDEFWHFHILDTRKYYSDCIQIFGCVMHHYPYFGMNGEDDKKNLEKCFSDTKEIYKSTFLLEMNMSYSSRCGGSSCGGRCKN